MARYGKKRILSTVESIKGLPSLKDEAEGINEQDLIPVKEAFDL